jgi:alcohol dehydrogenase class IV
VVTLIHYVVGFVTTSEARLITGYLRSFVVPVTNSRGNPVPCVAIPSTAGCGAACSTQTFVLNLEEGLLVPMKHSDTYEQQDTTVLIDPSLTTTLDTNLTIAMALTALSNCIDALLTTAHKVCICI